MLKPNKRKIVVSDLDPDWSVEVVSTDNIDEGEGQENTTSAGDSDDDSDHEDEANKDGDECKTVHDNDSTNLVLTVMR